MPEPQLIALAIVFVAWWLISACTQIRTGALTVPLRRYIPLGLIPQWTFFAPNPARADSRLLWREEQGGVWGTWQELHFGFAHPSSRWLMNPQLIQNKAVSDLANSLLQLRPELCNRAALLSSPYVALLNMVVAQPRSQSCSTIQFAIVRTSGRSVPRNIEIAFLSEPHDLDPVS